MTSWPFENLTPLKYGAILADPPWSYEMRSDVGHAKSPHAHYDCMTIEDIKALPVDQLAGGDCLLFMWSTWPHLKQAQAVMEAWGFTYKSGGAWFKKMGRGASAFGTSYIFRSSTEPYLVGTIGEPFYRARNIRNEILTADLDRDPLWLDDEMSWFPDAIEGLRREHSRKPPEARQILDTLLPHSVKAELFGREPWEGADVWGNQADKFAGQAA